MEALVARTGESTSIAQLDGSDIVYVARVAVPKIIALRVSIGTRFPAPQTSLGKVLLAGLPADELEAALAQPSRSGVQPRWRPERAELDVVLRDVRATGWALTDEQLAPGIRSVADRGDQRHGPCGGDLPGAAHERLPAPAPACRRRGERGLRALPGRAGGPRGPAARDGLDGLTRLWRRQQTLDHGQLSAKRTD
jgi:hypothetical protein